MPIHSVTTVFHLFYYCCCCCCYKYTLAPGWYDFFFGVCWRVVWCDSVVCDKQLLYYDYDEFHLYIHNCNKLSHRMKKQAKYKIDKQNLCVTVCTATYRNTILRHVWYIILIGYSRRHMNEFIISYKSHLYTQFLSEIQ